MNVDLPGGKYVVAVSGGVDSVALLHLLKHVPNLELTVAHFDHGIRPDSAEDRRHVQALAKAYGLPFVYHRIELGEKASEERARQARYAFLHEVKRTVGADAIVTAHHEDDVLETIILNLLRGTGSKGLNSLRSSDIVMRPLLHVTKRQLETYAKSHRLQWRQDATNDDSTYLRNYVRQNIVPRLGRTGRTQLLRIGARAAQLNEDIERHTRAYLHDQPHVLQLDRTRFIQLPHAVAREVLAEWLRLHTHVELTSRMLERLVRACKTGRARSRVDVAAGWRLQLNVRTIELLPPKPRSE